VTFLHKAGLKHGITYCGTIEASASMLDAIGSRQIAPARETDGITGSQTADYRVIAMPDD